MFKKVELQKREERRLMRWVTDLLSGKYVNCVYCGHRYGPTDTTPTSMSEILTEHIKHCEHHPLNSAIEVIKQLLPTAQFSCGTCENINDAIICFQCNNYNQWRLKEEIKCTITQLGILI